MREKLQKYLEQSLSHGARHGVTTIGKVLILWEIPNILCAKTWVIDL